jgi:ATP-dependent helicase IRC3
MPENTLRTYQHEAVQAVIAARKRGVRRMVVSLPTGAGKTVIFAELARLARKDVLVLAHREELLEQARARLQAALGPTRLVGIERADQRAPEDARVIVCSIRSLHEERLQRVIRGRDYALVLYDECHHAVAEDNKRVLAGLGCFDTGWSGTLLGLTATVNRADGQGLHSVFQEVVYSRNLADLMKEGWLVPLRGLRIATTADLTALSESGQDFDEEALACVVDIEERNALVARSIQEFARDRRTLAFCVTVGHARNLAKALNRIGVSAGIVYGEMARDARRDALEQFRKGNTRVLTNVGVLTEGFDDPEVSAIAMARPTRSEGLYAQCVGRGTRLYPGKKDCLVLDFVDLSNLSLLNLPSLFGLPRNIDLDGDLVTDAAAIWRQIELDLPAFQLEAEAITLAELQQRAASFDPLSLEVHPDVRAISEMDWHSLGRRGLVLHVLRKGRVLTITVLAEGRRGARWQVAYDGQEMARFAIIEDAVEAVEHEVNRMGKDTYYSAFETAPWRHRPASPDLLEEIGQSGRELRIIDAWRQLAHDRAYKR